MTDIYEKLIDAGFDDLENLALQTQSSIPLKIEDLKQIGISKLGEVYKFLFSLEEDALNITNHNSLYKSSTIFQSDH